MRGSMKGYVLGYLSCFGYAGYLIHQCTLVGKMIHKLVKHILWHIA